MNLNQLSLSFTADEVMNLYKTALARAAEGGKALPPEARDVHVAFQKNKLVLSLKKKLGFMPMTFSATIDLSPTTSGDGIVITIDKLSAGIMSSQAIVGQLMAQVRNTLGNVSGCVVTDNSIVLTKPALANLLPWLNIPGKVLACGIAGDTLSLAIG